MASAAGGVSMPSMRLWAIAVRRPSGAGRIRHLTPLPELVRPSRNQASRLFAMIAMSGVSRTPRLFSVVDHTKHGRVATDFANQCRLSSAKIRDLGKIFSPVRYHANVLDFDAQQAVSFRYLGNADFGLQLEASFDILSRHTRINRAQTRTAGNREGVGEPFLPRHEGMEIRKILLRPAKTWSGRHQRIVIS